MATHSSILAWRVPMDRGAWRAADHGVMKSRTRLSDSAEHSLASVKVFSGIRATVSQTVPLGSRVIP